MNEIRFGWSNFFWLLWFPVAAALRVLENVDVSTAVINVEQHLSNKQEVLV